MTPKKMLALFRAAQDAYGISSGRKTHAVYRRTPTVPPSRSPRKEVYRSKHYDQCVDWIERRAMSALKRAMR
jgi:hypothetical protein